MEVIRRGDDPAKQAIQAECNRCHSVIKFMPIEARYASNQREGSSLTIKCPVCANNIITDTPRGYVGHGCVVKCCAGGPQWGHAWDCPSLP